MLLLLLVVVVDGVVMLTCLFNRDNGDVYVSMSLESCICDPMPPVVPERRLSLLKSITGAILAPGLSLFLFCFCFLFLINSLILKIFSKVLNLV